MSLLFGLDPKYNRQMLENLLQNLNMLVSQLSRVWVDESARLVTRINYMDDGYIRIRDAGDTSYSMAQMTQELLRNLQYGFGVQERLLTSLTNALASVDADKFRVTVVDTLPLSPFNITQVSGTSLTARDWSQDFAKLQNIDTALSTIDNDIKGRRPRVIYDSSGNELSSYIKNMDTAISSFTSSPGSSPPSKGVTLLGYDGTYMRLVKTTSDGKVVGVLG